MAIPKNMYTSATARPKPETGTMSPYPTVVTVAMRIDRCGVQYSSSSIFDT